METVEHTAGEEVGIDVEVHVCFAVFRVGENAGDAVVLLRFYVRDGEGVGVKLGVTHFMKSLSGGKIFLSRRGRKTVLLTA